MAMVHPRLIVDLNEATYAYHRAVEQREKAA
jgi:hypothetical protein